MTSGRAKAAALQTEADSRGTMMRGLSKGWETD
jgi:hypothetical protein